MDKFQIRKEIQIGAPAKIVFESMLEQNGPGFARPDGTPMPLTLEGWPGGRWFRDLGNHSGHLWGHVQVIKPPTLLELVGPMFMSYPAIAHVQYRLTESSGGTLLAVTHGVLGELDQEHRDGVSKAWEYILEQIKRRCLR